MLHIVLSFLLMPFPFNPQRRSILPLGANITHNRLSGCRVMDQGCGSTGRDGANRGAEGGRGCAARGDRNWRSGNRGDDSAADADDEEGAALPDLGAQRRRRAMRVHRTIRRARDEHDRRPGRRDGPRPLRAADTQATKERPQEVLCARSSPATPATSARRAAKARMGTTTAGDDLLPAETDPVEGSGRDDSKQAMNDPPGAGGHEDDVAALADVIIDWGPEEIEEGHALLTRWQAALKNGAKRAVTLNVMAKFLHDIPPGAAKLAGFARAAEHTASSERPRLNKTVWLVDGMLKETEALLKLLKDDAGESAVTPRDKAATAPDKAAARGGCATSVADEVASPPADDNAPAAASTDTVPAPAATEAAPE